MKFKYKCVNKECTNTEEIIVKDKCPCKAFSKEFCDHCGDRMPKAKNEKDIRREEVLKEMRK